MISINENAEFNRDFKKGIKISWLLFFLSVLFIVFWALAYVRSYSLLHNLNSFSKLLFFINPKIFSTIFLEGNLLSYLKGAVNKNAFLFLISYLVTVITFIIIIILSIILFVISWQLSMKNFHYISIFALFPFVSVITIPWFLGKWVWFYFEMKKRGFSRFQKDWSPEEYREPGLQGIDLNNLGGRPITVAFTKVHYDRFFGKKKDYFREFHGWLRRQIV